MSGQEKSPERIFGYSDSEIDALQRSLSAERFGGYLKRRDGDRREAVRLYERNSASSAALFGVLQPLEIAMRNAISAELTESHGENWFSSINLEHPLNAKVEAAIGKVSKRGKPLAAGRVIAELSFGFWTGLISARYEKTLWVPHLHKAFPNAWHETHDQRTAAVCIVRVDRPEIFARLEQIRRLRNRIAHHEPIIDLDVHAQYRDIIEAIDWICPVTATWVASTSHFEHCDRL